MTSSAEEDLDGAIWMALRVYRVTCDDPLMLVESIRLAAQAYAAKDSDKLTQARRMVLHEGTRRRQRRVRPVTAGGGGGPTSFSPPGSLSLGNAVPPGGAAISTARHIPVLASQFGQISSTGWSRL